jgi:hypothetical protein
VVSDIVASDLVTDTVAAEWPESVPVHAVVIVDGLHKSGKHALQVVHDTDCPMWVLIGMLRSVLVDIETRWAGIDWSVDEEDDDD